MSERRDVRQASSRALSARRAEREAPSASWKRPGGAGAGFFGWLMTTNHKDIGLRYIMTAFVLLPAGGHAGAADADAAGGPREHFLGPDLYNQFFTIHGTTMMFLFAVPVMEGIGLYLVPLMVGTRNVAFPRLNASATTSTCSAGCCSVGGLLTNTGPDMGWFTYVPLARPAVFARATRGHLVADGHAASRSAALVGAVEIITTVFKQRAVGMSLNRIPLFVWAMVITSFMIIFAMPAVMLRSTMLPMDRHDARQHALLQPGRRRRRAALAAPVLVLRAPGGLHHLHPGDRVRLDDRARVLAAAGSSATCRWCCR